MMMAADLLASLEGVWSITRTIEPGGSLAGTASFARRPDGLLDYIERGELLLDGSRFATERRYLFEARENGFAVFFAVEPQRLFHEVVLARAADGALLGEAAHPCGPDMYLSSYHFAGDGFTITHRAQGPRKNYRLVTTYTRAARPGRTHLAAEASPGDLVSPRKGETGFAKRAERGSESPTRTASLSRPSIGSRAASPPFSERKGTAA